MSLMKIKDLFHFEKGGLQSSKCTPGEFDFITAAAEWKTHNEFSHECEALIFAAAASGSLGRTHYVNGKFVSSDLCFIITPKDPVKYPIDLKFYHLIFQAFKDEIVRNTKAGTSKEAIGLTAFGKYELPYFDIAKQQEVKEQFVTAQESTIGLDSELTHQLDLVKQLRQAFLREAMQGKLVPQDENDEPASVLLEKIKAEKERLIKEKKIKKQKPLPPITEDEIPFEIPENWVWCRLGELASIVRGGSPRPAGDPRYYGGEIPFLKVGDLTGYEGKFCTTHTYTIKEAGLYKTRSVKANTLMLTNSGATLGVPRICTFPTTFNDGIAAFLGIENLNKEFLFYFLREKSDYFLAEASRGQGQPNLNTDIISYTLHALPPLSEQQRIVAKLDELMAYCDELEASIKESQQQNEQLLQQVLREALEPKEKEVTG